MSTVIDFPEKNIKNPLTSPEPLNFTPEDILTDLENFPAGVNSNTYSFGATTSVEEALAKIYPQIIKLILEIFSDQVTCVCIKTNKPLFDMERAKDFRNQLDNFFKTTLEIIDEEIAENK